MRGLGLLLCWAGVLLPLLATIHVVTDTMTVAAGDVDGNESLRTDQPSLDLLRYSAPFGALLFGSGVVVLLVHWRTSRVEEAEADEPAESR